MNAEADGLRHKMKKLARNLFKSADEKLRSFGTKNSNSAKASNSGSTYRGPQTGGQEPQLSAIATGGQKYHKQDPKARAGGQKTPAPDVAPPPVPKLTNERHPNKSHDTQPPPPLATPDSDLEELPPPLFPKPNISNMAERRIQRQNRKDVIGNEDNSKRRTRSEGPQGRRRMRNSMQETTTTSEMSKSASKTRYSMFNEPLSDDDIVMNSASDSPDSDNIHKQWTKNPLMVRKSRRSERNGRIENRSSVSKENGYANDANRISRSRSPQNIQNLQPANRNSDSYGSQPKGDHSPISSHKAKFKQLEERRKKRIDLAVTSDEECSPQLSISRLRQRAMMSANLMGSKGISEDMKIIPVRADDIPKNQSNGIARSDNRYSKSDDNRLTAYDDNRYSKYDENANIGSYQKHDENANVGYNAKYHDNVPNQQRNITAKTPISPIYNPMIQQDIAHTARTIPPSGSSHNVANPANQLVEQNQGSTATYPPARNQPIAPEVPCVKLSSSSPQMRSFREVKTNQPTQLKKAVEKIEINSRSPNSSSDDSLDELIESNIQYLESEIESGKLKRQSGNFTNYTPNQSVSQHRQTKEHEAKPSSTTTRDHIKFHLQAPSSKMMEKPIVMSAETSMFKPHYIQRSNSYSSDTSTPKTYQSASHRVVVPNLQQRHNTATYSPHMMRHSVDIDEDMSKSDSQLNEPKSSVAPYPVLNKQTGNVIYVQPNIPTYTPQPLQYQSQMNTIPIQPQMPVNRSLSLPGSDTGMFSDVEYNIEVSERIKKWENKLTPAEVEEQKNAVLNTIQEYETFSDSQGPGETPLEIRQEIRNLMALPDKTGIGKLSVNLTKSTSSISDSKFMDPSVETYFEPKVISSETNLHRIFRVVQEPKSPVMKTVTIVESQPMMNAVPRQRRRKRQGSEEIPVVSHSDSRHAQSMSNVAFSENDMGDNMQQSWPPLLIDSDSGVRKSWRMSRYEEEINELKEMVSENFRDLKKRFDSDVSESEAKPPTTPTRPVPKYIKQKFDKGPALALHIETVPATSMSPRPPRRQSSETQYMKSPTTPRQPVVMIPITPQHPATQQYQHPPSPQYQHPAPPHQHPPSPQYQHPAPPHQHPPSPQYQHPVPQHKQHPAPPHQHPPSPQYQHPASQHKHPVPQHHHPPTHQHPLPHQHPAPQHPPSHQHPAPQHPSPQHQHPPPPQHPAPQHQHPPPPPKREMTPKLEKPPGGLNLSDSPHKPIPDVWSPNMESQKGLISMERVKARTLQTIPFSEDPVWKEIEGLASFDKATSEDIIKEINFDDIDALLELATGGMDKINLTKGSNQRAEKLMTSSYSPAQNQADPFKSISGPSIRSRIMSDSSINVSSAQSFDTPNIKPLKLKLDQGYKDSASALDEVLDDIRSSLHKKTLSPKLLKNVAISPSDSSANASLQSPRVTRSSKSFVFPKNEQATKLENKKSDVATPGYDNTQSSWEPAKHSVVNKPTVPYIDPQFTQLPYIINGNYHLDPSLLTEKLKCTGLVSESSDEHPANWRHCNTVSSTSPANQKFHYNQTTANQMSSQRQDQYSQSNSHAKELDQSVEELKGLAREVEFKLSQIKAKIVTTDENRLDSILLALRKFAPMTEQRYFDVRFTSIESDKFKKGKLEDALTELERIYESLDLNDSSLMDRAERREETLLHSSQSAQGTRNINQPIRRTEQHSNVQQNGVYDRRVLGKADDVERQTQNEFEDITNSFQVLLDEVTKQCKSVANSSAQHVNSAPAYVQTQSSQSSSQIPETKYTNYPQISSQPPKDETRQEPRAQFKYNNQSQRTVQDSYNTAIKELEYVAMGTNKPAHSSVFMNLNDNKLTQKINQNMQNYSERSKPRNLEIQVQSRVVVSQAPTTVTMATSTSKPHLSAESNKQPVKSSVRIDLSPSKEVPIAPIQRQSSSHTSDSSDGKVQSRGGRRFRKQNMEHRKSMPAVMRSVETQTIETQTSPVSNENENVFSVLRKDSLSDIFSDGSADGKGLPVKRKMSQGIAKIVDMFGTIEQEREKGSSLRHSHSAPDLMELLQEDSRNVEKSQMIDKSSKMCKSVTPRSVKQRHEAKSRFRSLQKDDLNVDKINSMTVYNTSMTPPISSGAEECVQSPTMKPPVYPAWKYPGQQSDNTSPKKSDRKHSYPSDREFLKTASDSERDKVKVRPREIGVQSSGENIRRRTRSAGSDQEDVERPKSIHELVAIFENNPEKMEKINSNGLRKCASEDSVFTDLVLQKIYHSESDLHQDGFPIPKSRSGIKLALDVKSNKSQ